jgi:uncharacterized protein (TIGR02246 family)
MRSAEAVVRSYFRNFEAADAAGVAAAFADDGAVMFNGRATIRGRDAIRAAFEWVFAQASMHCGDLMLDRVRERGDMAVVETRTAETITRRAGGTDTGSFREIFCLFRTDGDWRIVTYMGNSLGTAVR